MEPTKCIKCEGELEEGVYGGYQGRLINWAKEHSFWFGLKNARRVRAYRCKNCGYIENYSK